MNWKCYFNCSVRAVTDLVSLLVLVLGRRPKPTVVEPQWCICVGHFVLASDNGSFFFVSAVVSHHSNSGGLFWFCLFWLLV